MILAIIMTLTGFLAAGCATSRGVVKNPLVGSWTLAIDWYGGGSGEDHMMTINPDLTGSLEVQMGDLAKVTDVKIEGDILHFTLLVVKEDGEYPLSFEGTISGDTIRGSFEQGYYPVEGTRIQPSQ